MNFSDSVKRSAACMLGNKQSFDSYCRSLKSNKRDLRTNLFDKDMNVKSWKASELKFFDSNKENLENIIRSAEKMQSSIITNVHILKRMINPYAEKT